jgi:TRAP-type C4-dicarboxylate transport system permease small subunit
VSSPPSFAVYRTLIIQRHRHLKWRALDPLEAVLMVVGGVCISAFTLCVFLDVLTRTAGHPWLWLQQATTAFFAWGVFVGMAAATRRHDHIYLAEITRRLRGPRRTTIETLNRLVVLVVAGFMAWFGLQNTILDLGSYRMPWLIPLTVYTGVVPIAGVLIMLFSIEQMINGVVRGYEGPEDTELSAGEPVE